MSDKDLLAILLENPLLLLGSDEEFKYTRISLGIPKLDALLGGGIPKKRITILTGPTNVGKSFIASQVVRAVQKEGGLAGWIDLELSWDAEWMVKCGIDVDNILVAQPTTGEEAFDLIKEMMEAGVDLVIMDSIAGVVPSTVQDESFSYNPIAWQARFVNQSLPKLLPSLKHGAAFLAINQVRSSMGPVSLDNMPGGLAQQYFSHFILSLRRKGWIKEKEINVGFDIEIRARKSKAGGKPFESVIVPFRMEGGIDLLETEIRELIALEKITKSGAWFDVREGFPKQMGMKGIKKFYAEHPEILEEMKEEAGI